MKTDFRPLPAVFLTVFLLLFLSPVVNAQSVSLNGSSQYIALDNSAPLQLADFTLEAWIKIEGTGVITSSGTGTGGHTNIVPIITKGRAEAEVATKDVNYFLGYDLTTKRLLADFEDNATSANHPVTGTTAIGNCWTHVAATYNTTTDTWKLYINGVLDQTTALGGNFTPQFLSTVHVCIGSAFNSLNSVSGFFNGKIDEVRIWNTVRSDAQILASYAAELTSGTGLMGRWGLNDGTGSVAVNSISGGVAGTLTGGPLWKPGFNQPGSSSLDFNGTADYVTFGAAPSLNTTAPAATGFTLEAWIMIEGNGVTTSTGTGGLTAAIPIVAKGRGESEASGLNMNYFLGITSGDILVADFEEALGANTGLNRPITGAGAGATITRNVWTHVAVTYNIADGVWTLFKNGVAGGTLNLPDGIIPENISTQHASIGTAMTSTGAAAGFFNGKIDEVRIWNRARSGAEILANYNLELTSGSGLLGRWGLNEGCGLTAANSVSGSANGTLSSASGPVWSTSTFNNLAPNQPAGPSPADNSTVTSASPTLCATVSDPNGGNLQVNFYGRKKTTPGAKFTIIALPDTQFYTEEPQGANSGGGGHNGIFKSQTQWIANRRVDSNIAFVVQLGDCAQNGDMHEVEWRRADTAMKNIENPNVPVTDGIAYGICVGNHDQGPTGNGDPNGTTTFYNQYFGEARFTGRTYYGGHYGTNNDNHFQLFSSSGIGFIHISIEYFPNGTTSPLQAILNWADSLLKAYPNRKGIISSHNILGTGNPANFQGPGQKIYDDLKDNPNMVLMLAGHVAGEGRRSDVFNGNTVHTLMSDYQSGYTNGGNGWLRIMQFIPSLNQVEVKTYSPYTNGFQTGAGSQFTIPVNLSQPFTLIGTNSNVSSGSQACVVWPSLDQGSDYEWYVEISDGENITTGPIWTFSVPVFVAPSVTTQPLSQSKCPGDPVSFISAATGNLPPTVQWQVSTDNGVNWSTIPAATNPTLTFNVLAGDNGNQYRAVWTNTSGADTSDAATLTIIAYTITVTQTANGTISPGTISPLCHDNQTFTITPSSCYFVADVLVDNVSAGAVTSYIFTDITANHTITATYAPIVITVSNSTVITPVICPGDNNGSMNLVATGGTGSLLYSIDGGANYFSSGLFTNLSGITYAVRIKDAQNCTKDTSISLAPVVAHWIGVVDNNWHNPANWNTGKVPNERTHVVIDSGTPFNCVISSANAEAASIRSKASSNAEVSPGRTLLVHASCSTLPPE
jgi:hypothetical protein